MANYDNILESISKLTIIELDELVKAFEDKFGVSAASLAPAATSGGAVAPAVEEKTEFTVNLNKIGANKINVIKAVREITALGLKEAKELVDGAPKPVKENVPKADAEKFKKLLEDAGAEAEIK